MSGQQGGAAEGIGLLTLTVAGNSTQLRPVAFEAEEAISETFQVTVELVSTTAAIDPDSVLYKPACLTMARQHSGDRKFNGIIRSFVASGTPVRGHWRYTAVIVPRLWFMKQTTDCRIFAEHAADRQLQHHARNVRGRHARRVPLAGPAFHCRAGR